MISNAILQTLDHCGALLYLCDVSYHCSLLVSETAELPLPEDYALQELHQLTRSYLLGVAIS